MKLLNTCLQMSERKLGLGGRRLILLEIRISIILKIHYENMPMQHTAIVHGCKNDNFRLTFFEYFHIFAQNIDCGYMLEPPH